MDFAVDRRRVGVLKEKAAFEFSVVLIFDAYRETALVSDDRRQLPAIRKLARDSFLFRDRQLPHRTEYEAVLGAQEREAASGIEVKGIQLLLKRSALVDGFAERVRG